MFLKKLRKNYSNFGFLEKKLMSFNHSASDCMKSLSIICSKLAKVTSKQCSGVILISQFFRIMPFKVIRMKGRSLEYFFVMLSYTLSAYCLHRVSTITSKKLSAKRSSNVTVLLWYNWNRGYKAWGEHWLGLISVTSRTKFFVITVNGWESLIVESLYAHLYEHWTNK